MIAIQLMDKTIIYSKNFTVGSTAIFVEDFKYINEDDVSFVEDGMSVSLDAIERYFMIKGNKDEIPED